MGRKEAKETSLVSIERKDKTLIPLELPLQSIHNNRHLLKETKIKKMLNLYCFLAIELNNICIHSTTLPLEISQFLFSMSFQFVSL